MLSCPICGKRSLALSEVHKEIPYFGRVILASWRCFSCGYRHVDVFSLEVREPSRYTFKVKEADDLNVKVIRSSSGTIRIPELGVLIEPGPISQGFITNVEGVLERVENIVKSFMVLFDDKHEVNRCTMLLNKIRKARNGSFQFTLIIEDPRGVSAIIPIKYTQRVCIERLSNEELKKLKMGWYVVEQN